MNDIEQAKDEHSDFSPRLAVFNGHVNDAHKRAMRVLKRYFPKYHAKIKKHHKAGIMEIFNNSPNDATSAYAALVTAFVNEG